MTDHARSAIGEMRHILIEIADIPENVTAVIFIGICGYSRTRFVNGEIIPVLQHKVGRGNDVVKAIYRHVRVKVKLKPRKDIKLSRKKLPNTRSLRKINIDRRAAHCPAALKRHGGMGRKAYRVHSLIERRLRHFFHRIASVAESGMCMKISV